MFDLLVDVSNACRDEYLGGGQVSWDRLDRLLLAWREQVNASSRPLLVADDNLAGDFRDRASLDRWRRELRAGTLISAPDADAVILDQARQTGASVLSRDAFVSHRRRHSWIQGDAEHFWRWTTSGPGEIEMRLEPMGKRSDYSITRAAEADVRKRLGLVDAQLQRIILSRMYKCENVHCAISGPRLREIPAVSNSLPVCPSCRRALRDRGPRPAARQIKILDYDELVGTEDIGDGEAVIFGTAPETAINVDLSMLRDASTLRSHHVRVAVEGGQAVVEPASDGPVWMQRWLGKAWQPLEAISEATTLRRRDRVVLPGGVALEQSGKDYVVPPEEW